MHILILNYEFPPLGGGAGNATYYLLRELAYSHPERSEGSRDSSQAQNDLRITLVTSSVGGYKEEQFAPNIKIHYLDIGKKGRNLHYQSIKDLLSYSWAAYRFCKWLKKKEKIDLVHAFFGIPCGYIAMKLGLPYIVSLRGTDVPFYNKRFYCLDNLVFKRLSGKIWQRAKKVVANSEGLKQLAQKCHPNQDISIIPNGVDTDIFKPASPLSSSGLTRGSSSQPFTILSTSRLIQRKGIEYLIDGFADFNQKYPNSRLVLVGSGNMVGKLKKRAKLAGLTKNLTFLGAVEKAEIPYIYQQSDVFVLPSLAEGMSNAILEAMASGLAILSTNVGGTSELLGKNGFIIEKGSSKAIFDALEKLYLNNELLSLMKVASRLKAEQMSWTKMAGQYSQLYRSTILSQIKMHSGNFESNLLFLEKTKILNKSMKILEIGSGSGALVNHFLNQGFDITGAEVADDRIIFAKENFKIELIKLSGEKLPFESNKFDIVLSFDVFEHIENSNFHLKEVRRILKPGGDYLLSTPNKWTNIPFEIIRNKGKSKWKEYHCSLHSYWEAKKRFKQNGFKIEFDNIPIYNDFFKNQTKKYLGSIGAGIIKIINLDKLPMPLKTNFFIKAKASK